MSQAYGVHCIHHVELEVLCENEVLHIGHIFRYGADFMYLL